MEKSVLVVEDEPLIADDLSFYLKDLGIDHVDVSLKYDDAMDKLTKNSFDLALLDVNLSGEQDGIHLANFINNKLRTPFIFITSYYDRETLERAKKTNPYGYILKPFDKQDIYVNVEMAFHKMTLNAYQKPDKFFVKDKEGLTPVDPADILYVEAFDNYAKVFTGDHSYIVSHTLKSIENKLVPFGFDRVHKSYLINFAKISRISEGYIFFGEIAIPIGRAYKTEFLSKLSLL
ncbi:MAG: LytTR family transcriptional regulator DNA-binding domain-containing protein [Bacteroidota bacterium]